MSELTLQQIFDAAVQFQQMGRPLDAQLLYKQVLTLDANHAKALRLLGILTAQSGQPQAAVELLNRAIAADPLAAAYRGDLGVVLQKLGRDDEAIAAYRLALEMQPDLSDAWCNLAHALNQRQKWDEAIAACRKALAIRADDPAAYNHLGLALCGKGDFEQAIATFRAGLVVRPADRQLHNNLGTAYYRQGEIEPAMTAFRQALVLEPNYAEAHNNLGNALYRQGQLDKAIDEYGKAVAASEHLAAARINLANALAENGQLDEALAAFAQVLKLLPDHVPTILAIGRVHSCQGNWEESRRCYDRAAAIEPANAAVHSSRVYAQHFQPDCDAAALLKAARDWNWPSVARHRNDPSPDRRLRLGYVSGDFRKHFVGANLLPALSGRDRGNFEVFCYSNVARPDSFTELLRAQADHWRDIAHCGDEQVTEMIRNDRIDILVDLTMHMPGNRLPVFAHKPAPVQVSYLAYCSTTGMEAIDYRLSDPHLDPSDTDLSCYLEQTFRLPETYWCYQPWGPTPEPSPSPALKTGWVTFGCLNHFSKVSPAALHLWDQILLAAPKTRLLLHSHAGRHLDAVRRRFSDKGISPDRVEFIGRQNWPQYIATYQRIDISLDPLPFGGGVTTCDSLWMGVPVVSLSGPTAVGRSGRSILSNIGMPELVARRPRQYVQTALSLSHALPRLAELRDTLRQRMLSSPLMNARRFARNMESAYRQMWRQWCAKQTL